MYAAMASTGYKGEIVWVIIELVTIDVMNMKIIW
ncbi:hypothetical protein M527_12755 [Sphingobium indicum IP26]|nr:hypothetical protein M527_29080 [Sphingobium indicum IP26]EPR18357.1 hypothetical protein M527_12755 [Sphingobium indicum IP26]EQB03655.1 hypothetical protein L286_11555 [Sphingobium sp. HDIP04]